jgi:DNA-directed RNA polymerase sigma subunit (sigma70/sigma32)
MTTTTNVKPAKPTAETKKAHDGVSTMVTLDQLAREMKLPPREVRMMLRLAAKQTKLYPNLGKEHVARQPWQWTPGSKGLEEARKALIASTNT